MVDFSGIVGPTFLDAEVARTGLQRRTGSGTADL
jgi:hypothetical protein